MKLIVDRHAVGLSALRFLVQPLRFVLRVAICSPMYVQLIELWDYHGWAIVACGFAVLATIAIFADRRRAKRHRIDDVGFMPWTGITVFAILATLVAAILEIKMG
ncbi:MAG: hypothetical protein IPH79_01230 [Sphingomonadales bacterium]|nr:hypothetical protein [Sphingomonadales bacterium]